jgi:hypothetical protein
MTYRVQDGCWNCKYSFIPRGSWGINTYCNLSGNHTADRYSGLAITLAPFYGTKEGRKTIVNGAGICSHHTKKGENDETTG